MMAHSDELAAQICNALGIALDQAGRIIIDIEPGEPVKIYLAAYAGKWIEAIDWARFLTGTEVGKQDSLTEEFIREAEASQWTGLNVSAEGHR